MPARRRMDRPMCALLGPSELLKESGSYNPEPLENTSKGQNCDAHSHASRHGDDDVVLAFRRRCLFVRAVQARQTVHSAGMIGTTTRELDCSPLRRGDGRLSIGGAPVCRFLIDGFAALIL